MIYSEVVKRNCLLQTKKLLGIPKFMMPAGWLFGLLFFMGLFGAAYLSDVAAFEVMVGGLVDNTKIKRKQAVIICCSIVFFLAIPPMINYRVFIPWDLIFGSGMQVIGAFFAVVTVAWCVKRVEFMREISSKSGSRFPTFLYWWMRILIPVAILFVGLNWLIEAIFK